MKQVKISCESGIGNATSVVDLDTGAELWVAEATISIKPREVVRADLTLDLVAVDVKAAAKYGVIDPRTKKFRLLQKLTFDDGEELHF